MRLLLYHSLLGFFFPIKKVVFLFLEVWKSEHYIILFQFYKKLSKYWNHRNISRLLVVEVNSLTRKILNLGQLGRCK